MSYLNTWTIPTDPGYQTRRSDGATVRDSDCKRAKPRIKPEAMSIALKSQGTVAQLFNPYSKPYSIGSGRPGTGEVKRNFVKENAKQIQIMQKSNQKSKRSSSREPLKVIHKSDRFEHVESKVAQELKGSPQAPRSTTSSFLKKHSRSGSPVRDKPVSVRSVGPSDDKLTVPKAKLEASKDRPNEFKTNHISKNIRQAAGSPVLRRRAPSAVATEELEKKRLEHEKNYKRGHVPNYLKKRQEQWRLEEEERIRNMPDPSIPPGHTLMPRDERLQTLELLNKKHQEMTKELNSLPVSCDTLRIKARKNELENKLREIESALKIFSRPKVFVKVDS